jgi:hypothetical protein
MNTSKPNPPRHTRIASVLAGLVCVLALLCLLPGSNFAQAQSPQTTPQGSANSCGFSWSHEGAPISGFFTLSSIDALSSSDVWAVGTAPYSQVILEHWDGHTWTVTPQSAISGNVTGLSVVSAIAPDNVWAFGTSDTSSTVPVHWDGTSWSTLPGSPVPITILDGEAISNNDIWLVGYRPVAARHASYATHWDGSTWTIIPVPGGIYPNSELQAISVVAPDDIWVVGFSSEDSTRIAFTSHWDGSAWTPIPLPALGTASTLNDITSTASDDVWAVGNYYDGELLSVVLHWNGTEWAIEDALGNMPETVVALAPGDIWVMGTGPFVQVQHLDPYFGWIAVGGPGIFPENSIPGFIRSTGVDGELWVVGTTLTSNGYTGWIRHYSEKFVSYADVAEDAEFFPYIKCLSCAGVISGYPCGGAGEPCNASNDPYFRPSVSVTRGQLAKIVAGVMGEPLLSPAEPTFQDVPFGSTFYTYVEAIAVEQIISGYPCGGPGEPCIAPDNKPYFRPSVTSSRAQLAKIVAEAADFADPIPPGTQTFADVPEGSTFHLFIERLAERSIINGYPCGGPGEPCDPQNRPYFRPASLVTRGQSAKIVSNAFLPSCSVSGAK